MKKEREELMQMMGRFPRSRAFLAGVVEPVEEERVVNAADIECPVTEEDDVQIELTEQVQEGETTASTEDAGADSEREESTECEAENLVSEAVEQTKPAEAQDDSEPMEERKIMVFSDARMIESLKMLAGYQAGSDMSDEQMDESLLMLLNIAYDIQCGIIGVEMMRSAGRALKYDNDIVQARHEGEVAGRNSKIEQLIAEHTTVANEVPHLPSASVNSAPRKKTIFDLAAQAR